MSIIVSNLNTTFFTMHVLALGDQLADDHTGSTRRAAEDNRLAMVELRDEEAECLLLKSSWNIALHTTGGIS